MKSKKFILMNPDQFEELKAFYLSLGLTEKQAERLQKQVFQYPIKSDEKISYLNTWEFYPRMESSPTPSNGGTMKMARAFSRAGSTAASCAP